MKTAKLIDPLCFIALGGLTLYFAQAHQDENVIVSPAFFPRMVAILMIIMNLLRIITIIFKQEKVESNQPPLTRTGYKSVLIALASLVGYFGLNYLIGFLLSTIIFVFGLMYLLGNRRFLQSAVFCLAVAFSISAIFKYVLVLPLPQGVLF